MTTPVEVMKALADLADVTKALNLLAHHKIIRQESVVKGCKKFVSDHPCINQHLAELDTTLSKAC